MTARARLGLLWAAVAAVIVVGIVANLAGAAGSPSAANATRDDVTHVALAVNDDGCGEAWSATSGGHVEFDVTNGGSEMDVYLEDPASKKVYVEIEALGMGATSEATAVLGDGSYRTVCYPNDKDATVGPTVTVTGAGHPADATVGIVPLTSADMAPIAAEYQKWVYKQLPSLHQKVRRLRTDVARGELGKAKADWLDAHLKYETLGAAYDAFGDDDALINGEPGSGKTARGDPDLKGFHKIEALLWGGATTTQILPYVDDLDDAVADLQKQFSTAVLEPLIISLRAHEIVENAIQFELTGATDAGSHTNLATISANLTGAAQALDFLRPVLQSRYAQLPQTDQALAAAQRLVDGYDHDGTWTPLTDLTTAQHEQLDSSLDGLVELLAPVAAICDPRNQAP